MIQVVPVFWRYCQPREVKKFASFSWDKTTQGSTVATEPSSKHGCPASSITFLNSQNSDDITSRQQKKHTTYYKQHIDILSPWTVFKHAWNDGFLWSCCNGNSCQCPHGQPNGWRHQISLAAPNTTIQPVSCYLLVGVQKQNEETIEDEISWWNMKSAGLPACLVDSACS